MEQRLSRSSQREIPSRAQREFSVLARVWASSGPQTPYRAALKLACLSREGLHRSLNRSCLALQTAHPNRSTKALVEQASHCTTQYARRVHQPLNVSAYPLGSTLTAQIGANEGSLTHSASAARLAGAVQQSSDGEREHKAPPGRPAEWIRPWRGPGELAACAPTSYSTAPR